MAWKKSNDGGIDFVVEELIEQHKRDEQPEKYNPFATATTVIVKFSQEEVKFEPPLTPKEKIEKFKKKQTKRKSWI